ncbi:hypothetical protein G6F68_016643 [Rhizopus microsporus]|nr:hypothetical protein G6F68_016643 [Rhizopus microsporus]
MLHRGNAPWQCPAISAAPLHGVEPEARHAARPRHATQRPGHRTPDTARQAIDRRRPSATGRPRYGPAESHR